MSAEQTLAFKFLSELCFCSFGTVLFQAPLECILFLVIYERFY